MAYYYPIKYREASERRKKVAVMITTANIEHYTNGPFDAEVLPSGDIMYYNVLAQHASRKENINEIVTAIANKKLYGPILILESRELK